MRRVALQTRKWAILIHRWMGVMFCVLFLAWFISGIVMMYWGYPKISPVERLAKTPFLNAAAIRLTPQQAAAALGSQHSFSQLRMTTLDGRPAYLFTINRKARVVFADNGECLDAVPEAMALRIASRWTGLPAPAALRDGLLTNDDQWTVNPSVRPFGPFWKFSWPNGESVYVSQSSGQVAQHTTRGSRLGGWLGAVPHWIYFTPLRRDARLWNDVVTWSSGIGTVMSLLGMVAGVWLYSPSKRYRLRTGASSVPYSGQKHWHVILGLVFGLVTCTWIFSGMMSMSPFPSLRNRPNSTVETALRGTPQEAPAYAAKDPRAALAEVAPSLQTKELEFATFGGVPYYLAVESPGRSQVVPVKGAPFDEFSERQIVKVVGGRSGSEKIAQVRVVREQETYYVDRHNERPFPVLFIQLADAQESSFYIDPRTARVVQSYTGISKWNRWLYHGLHSLDLPWLYRFRPAWDIVVMVLMLGGTALCVTSVVIGWRRLRQKLRHPV